VFAGVPTVACFCAIECIPAFVVVPEVADVPADAGILMLLAPLNSVCLLESLLFACICAVECISSFVVVPVIADVPAVASILILLAFLSLRESKLFLASLIYFLPSCGVQVCNSDPAVTAVSAIAVVIPADPGFPVVTDLSLFEVPAVACIPLLASLLILINTDLSLFEVPAVACIPLLASLLILINIYPYLLLFAFEIAVSIMPTFFYNNNHSAVYELCVIFSIFLVRIICTPNS
jgi:hypothetical protein